MPRFKLFPSNSPILSSLKIEYTFRLSIACSTRVSIAILTLMDMRPKRRLWSQATDRGVFLLLLPVVLPRGRRQNEHADSSSCFVGSPSFVRICCSSGEEKIQIICALTCSPLSPPGIQDDLSNFVQRRRDQAMRC